MADQALRSYASSQPVRTLVPGHKAIDLVAYYLHQVDYYPECELQTKRWFVENAQPDWVMFDVGANIGYYSILFSRLAPAGQIFAFEPTETVSMLMENLAHHQCRNVKASQIALGMVTGSVEDQIFRIWGSEPEKRTYDFSTVDDLVQKLKLTRLDCIKIDVDSFDFEVLMGAEETLKQFNPWVVVELCHALSRRNQSAPEALEWLAQRGYRKAHVLEHENYVLRRDPDGGASSNDNSILLTFETRPIILPPSLIKEAPAENLFISQPRLHNGATVVVNRSGNQVSIAVPGPRWAYASTWPRRDDLEFDQPFIVEFKVHVSGGSVGVGCLVGDLTQYVGKEINIAPSSELQTVCICVEDHAAARNLVLRNIDSAGNEAQVTIYDICCFRAKRGDV